MKKSIKYVALPALAAMVAWSVGSTGLAVDRSLLTTPKRMNGLSLARQTTGQSTVPVLLSTQSGQAEAVARLVKQLGGRVTEVLAGSDFVVAKVPAKALQELERAKAVRAMALDRPVKLDPTAMKPLSEKAARPLSETDPDLSLKVTRGEIRAPQFTEATGSDGTGAVIAVLDTGVDPAHPALLKTPDGNKKIIDWQDFTGEGDVETKETRSEAIPGIGTKSGTYRLGKFHERQIPDGELKSDINRNGKNDDTFGILLTDAAAKGVYDTAYVDTNANGDFTDEKPLRTFKSTGDVGLFGSAEQKDGAQQGVSFVVTRINADGSGLNLGYDGGQHGTHVAGIAAGSGPVTGVAPGAKVIAIKVLTSGGSGSWGGIVKGMEYAASQGAHVINMSLGGLSEDNDGNDPQSLLIKDLSAKYGTLFSIAAGNSGPGLNTMGLPGVAGAAITSGAFISKTTWKVDYGLNVPEDGLWYFSSAGPRDDGGLKPNIVAPGTANSAIPTWGGAYAVFQGTSMAAPQTSGAAALLVSAAQYRGLKTQPAQLTMALETSARRLPGYGWFEQGHGLIQVDAAWAKLQKVSREKNPALVSFGRAKAGIQATGLYAREFTPGPQDSRWVIGNREFFRSTLNLTYLPGRNLTVSGPASVTVPALMRKEIPLRYDYAGSPGLYDALIQARVPGQTGYAAEYLATVVVPFEFDARRGNVITGMEGTLGPARYARHFIRVPEGTAEIAVNLNVPGNQGRVRVMAYTPDGMPYGPGTAYAGAPQGPERQTMTIVNPTPGVWEIDAYASHGSMNFGLAENQYVIDVAAKGVFARPKQIDLAPAFGTTQQRTITFENYFDDIQGVVAGAGFAQPVTKRIDVEQDGFNDQFFDVEEGTALLRVSISEVLDPQADLEMALYYNDPALGGWTPVGTVTGHRIGQQVTLPAPGPGQYAMEVIGKSVPLGKTSLSFAVTKVRGGEAIAVKDQPAERSFGSAWTVPVSIRIPTKPGTHLGAVTVKDEKTGRMLAVVPVEIK